MTVSNQRFIPSQTVPLINKDGSMNSLWYKFFLDLNQGFGGDGKTEIAPENLPNTITSSSEAVSGQGMTATDTGTDVTVTVDGGFRTLGKSTIEVQAGSVTGLAYDTSYVIYFRDPNRQGGVVTYLASQQIQPIMTDTANIIIGSVTTPAAGQPPSTNQPSQPDYQPNIPPGGSIP